jgi:hypothetical protein
MSEYTCPKCGEEVGMMGHGPSPCSGKLSPRATELGRLRIDLRTAIDLASESRVEALQHELCSAAAYRDRYLSALQFIQRGECGPGGGAIVQRALDQAPRPTKNYEKPGLP